MSASIPSWARVGAKVVCVSTNPAWATLPVQSPIVGETYTLRDVDIDPIDGVAICWVKEIPEQFCRAPGAFGLVTFGLFRFRPLVEDSDELGIETQLYRAKGRKSKAPARESERA